MGDMWLWRHDKTIKIQNILSGLHKLIPAAMLRSMLEDIDKEMVHIKKNMPEHPPLRSTGQFKNLTNQVTPSQSASECWRRENERKAKILNQKPRPSDKESGRRIRERKIQQVAAENVAAQDEEGSDSDPSSARIKYSIRLVDGWLKKCNELTEDSNGCESDDVSIISEAFLGVAEKPKLNIKDIWWRGSTRRQRVSPTHHSIARSHSSKAAEMPTNNCIYDSPSTLRPLLRHKKAEKLSERRNISISEAVRISKARGLRQVQRYMVFGGSSPGPAGSHSPLITVRVSQGSAGNSIESSISLTPSEIGKCLDSVAVGPRGDVCSGSSLISSRPSAVNIGSIIEQPRSSLHSESPNGKNSRKTGTFSKNLLLTFCLGMSEIGRSTLTKYPQSTHFLQTETLIPIGRDHSPASSAVDPKLRRDDWQVSGQFLGKEPPKQGGSSRHDKISRLKYIEKMNGGSTSIDGMQVQPKELSEAVKNSRRRRAERAVNATPFNDRYHQAERGKAWSRKPYASQRLLF